MSAHLQRMLESPAHFADPGVEVGVLKATELRGSDFIFAVEGEVKACGKL